MIGVEVQWAAYGLIVFTIVATLVLVNFWRMSGERRAAAINIFLAHLGVLGGLLLAAAPN